MFVVVYLFLRFNKILRRDFFVFVERLSFAKNLLVNFSFLRGFFSKLKVQTTAWEKTDRSDFHETWILNFQSVSYLIF